MKKKIIFLTFLMITLSFFTLIISNASTTSNGSAFFIRSTRLAHTIATNRAMSNALDAFEHLKYSAQGFTDPIESLFVSNVMERDVQEYLCHGYKNMILFDYVGLSNGSKHDYVTCDWSKIPFARMGRTINSFVSSR